MRDRGTIVLVPFPFTDLTAQKVRPALVVSRGARRSRDVIVAFISSVPAPARREHVAVHDTDPGFSRTGLKGDSIIRCEKLATLDRRIVIGILGRLPDTSLCHVDDALRFTLGL